jgi:hypothetical protein
MTLPRVRVHAVWRYHDPYRPIRLLNRVSAASTSDDGRSAAEPLPDRGRRHAERGQRAHGPAVAVGERREQKLVALQPLVAAGDRDPAGLPQDPAQTRPSVATVRSRSSCACMRRLERDAFRLQRARSVGLTGEQPRYAC